MQVFKRIRNLIWLHLISLLVETMPLMLTIKLLVQVLLPGRLQGNLKLVTLQLFNQKKKKRNEGMMKSNLTASTLFSPKLDNPQNSIPTAKIVSSDDCGQKSSTTPAATSRPSSPPSANPCEPLFSFL